MNEWWFDDGKKIIIKKAKPNFKMENRFIINTAHRRKNYFNGMKGFKFKLSKLTLSSVLMQLVQGAFAPAQSPNFLTKYGF